jgi:glutamine cyclotransferase
MRKTVVVSLSVLTAAALGFAAWGQLGVKRAKPGSVAVIASYPHDPAAFTQGLLVEGGKLYESTGQYGESSLRLVELETGRVLQLFNLNRAYFGEGIAAVGNRIYQLTWQNRTGIVYDLETFEPVESFRYAGEGWGITYDGSHLIVSDGTSELRFLDPDTLELVNRVVVRDADREVVRINELEFIDGEVWANIWYEDRIARIDPADGRVLSWLDLSHVYPAAERRSREQVLNGIAYDAGADRIFVTGKNWPRLYEIEVGGR